MHEQGYIFIGMSGSGKTTLGRIIAKTINYQFFDSDKLIEKEFHNENLYEIVERHQTNLQNFIELEKRVIKKIAIKKSVLATGGSACYSKDVLKEKNATIIYLHISWNVLKKRIGDFSKRGVILFQESLEKEYQHRLKLYEELADLKIHCDLKPINSLKKEILNKI